jgi:hypothetical protein
MPATDERLGFGDIISAPWLFDLYLRHDAVALKAEDQRGGRRWLENRVPRPERTPGNDGVLSHADEALGSGNPRLAIVLTDDCELETLQIRRETSGRVLLAAIRQASDDEIASAQKRRTYRRFVLPPDQALGFAGGIVELQRIFSVFLPSLTLEEPAHSRLLALEPDAQRQLSQALCAHVTRHGPLVAAQEAGKLAMLMSANGDPEAFADFKRAGSTREPEPLHANLASAIARGLTHAWILEGDVLNYVSDEFEDGADAAAGVHAVRDELLRARDAMDEALRLLDEAADTL